MNRTFNTIAVVALLVAGCGANGNNGDGGGGGNSGGNGSADLSAAAGSDMTMTLPPDMQPAYGCHALAGCLAACSDQTTCGLCIQSAIRGPNAYNAAPAAMPSTDVTRSAWAMK